MIRPRRETYEEDIPKRFTWKPPFSYEARCLCSLLRWILRRIFSVWFLFSFYFCFTAILFSHLLIFINFFITSHGVDAKFAQNKEFVFQYTIDFTRDWLEEAPQMLDIVGDWLVLNENEGTLGEPRMVNDINDTYVFRKIGFYSYSMIDFARIENALLFSNSLGDFQITNPPDPDDDPPLFWVGYLVANDTPEVCCPYEGENETSAFLNVDYINQDDFSLDKRGFGLFPYDPRAMPWYSFPSSSMNCTDFYWSNHLTAAGVISSSVSRNVMTNKDTNERLGVLGSGLLLYRWESIISSLGVEPGILLFIDQSDDGLLLSSSDPATEVSRIDEATGILTRLKVEETNHTVVVDAAEFMKSEISETGSVNDIVSFEHRTFSSEGEKWHIRAQRVEITGNFRILVVYLIRDLDVYYDVYRSNYISFATSYLLMGFFLFFFLIFIMCFCFYCPLNMFTREMKKVEKMDMESINLTCTSLIFFREIRTLRRRFKACVVELEKIRSFLPSGILHHHSNEDKKDKDDDDDDVDSLNLVYFRGSSDSQSDRDEIMCDDGIPEVRRLEVTYGSDKSNSSSDDTNDKDSREESHSSNNENSSSSNSSLTKYTRNLSIVRQKRRFNRRRRTFPVQDLPYSLYECEVLGIYISIINWKELISNPRKKDENYNLSIYLKMFSEFLEFAIKSFQGGMIVSFGMDHVTFAFVDGMKVVDGVKQVLKFTKKFERKKRELFLENTRRQTRNNQEQRSHEPENHHFTQHFRLFVSTCLENTIVGEVGSKRAKRLVHFDGAIERAVFISERFTEFVIPLINTIKGIRRRNRTTKTTTTIEEEKNLNVSIEKEERSVHVFCDSNVKDLISIRRLNIQTYPIDVCLHHYGKESESRPSRTGYISSINCERVIIYQVDIFKSNMNKKGKKTDKYKLMTGIFDICLNQDFRVSWNLLRSLLGQGIDFDEELKKIEVSTISDFLEVCKIRFMKKIVGFVKEKNIDLEEGVGEEEDEEDSGFRTSTTSLDISDDGNLTDDCISLESPRMSHFTDFDDMMDQNAWDMEKNGHLFDFLSVL